MERHRYSQHVDVTNVDFDLEMPAKLFKIVRSLYCLGGESTFESPALILFLLSHGGVLDLAKANMVNAQALVST